MAINEIFGAGKYDVLFILAVAVGLIGLIYVIVTEAEGAASDIPNLIQQIIEAPFLAIGSIFQAIWNFISGLFGGGSNTGISVTGE